MGVSAVNETQQVTQVAGSAKVQQANQTEQTFNYEATEDDRNMGLVVESANQDTQTQTNENKTSRNNIFTDIKIFWQNSKQYFSDISSKGIKEVYKDFWNADLERCNKYLEEHPFSLFHHIQRVKYELLLGQ